VTFDGEADIKNSPKLRSKSGLRKSKNGDGESDSDEEAVKAEHQSFLLNVPKLGLKWAKHLFGEEHSKLPTVKVSTKRDVVSFHHSKLGLNVHLSLDGTTRYLSPNGNWDLRLTPLSLNIGPSNVSLAKNPKFLALRSSDDVEVGVSFAAKSCSLTQYILLKKDLVDGKIVLKAQFDGVTFSLDANQSQLILKKDDSVVSVFTAKIYHLHDDEIHYSPAIVYDAASSELSISVADKPAPILLVFSISSQLISADELLKLFRLHGGDDDESGGDDDGDDESKHHGDKEKDKKSTKESKKSGLKIGFGLHFKKPSKTSSVNGLVNGNLSSSQTQLPPASVYTNKNNEYFVVNPKVNMVCQLNKEGLLYKPLLSSIAGSWKVHMNLTDMKIASLSAKSKNTVSVERVKTKDLELDEIVKYFDKHDQTGILHSFKVEKGPTPLTLTQNVALKGIGDIIQDQKGITFCASGGSPVLLYKYMDVFDSTGKLLKSNMTFDSKKNLLTVKVLEVGEYPILIQ